MAQAHRRPISIGDASSLFGAPNSGGGEDFFGSPSLQASKAPAFGTVQEEEEEGASRDLAEQQQHGGYSGQGDYATGYGQDSSYEWGQQQGGYGHMTGQEQGQSEYGGTNGYQNQSWDQVQYAQSYGGYSSPPTQHQAYAPSPPYQPSSNTYDPYSPQASASHDPYSPSLHSYASASQSQPSYPRSPSVASTGPSTTSSQPAQLQRPTTYDAYDPPPLRRKSTATHSLNTSLAQRVATPPIPAGSPLSFGQVMDRGASPAFSQGAGVPPLPPKKKGAGPVSRPGSVQPQDQSRPPPQQQQAWQQGGQQQTQRYGVASPPPARPASQQSQSYGGGPALYQGQSQGRYDPRGTVSPPLSQSQPQAYDPYAPSGQQQQPFSPPIHPTQQHTSQQMHDPYSPSAQQQDPYSPPTAQQQQSQAHDPYFPPFAQHQQQAPDFARTMSPPVSQAPYQPQQQSQGYGSYGGGEESYGVQQDPYQGQRHGPAGRQQQRQSSYGFPSPQSEPEQQPSGQGSFYDQLPRQASLYDHQQPRQSSSYDQQLQDDQASFFDQPSQQQAQPDFFDQPAAVHGGVEDGVEGGVVAGGAPGDDEEEFDYEQQAAAFAAQTFSDSGVSGAGTQAGEEGHSGADATYGADQNGIDAEGGTASWQQQPPPLPPKSREAVPPPPKSKSAQPEPAEEEVPAPLPPPPPRKALAKVTSPPPPPPSISPAKVAQPTPPLFSNPQGENVADFQSAIGGTAHSSNGLHAASRDANVLSTLGIPQSTVPEPDGEVRGAQSTTRLDGGQRLRTPVGDEHETVKVEEVKGTKLGEAIEESRVSVPENLQRSLLPSPPVEEAKTVSEAETGVEEVAEAQEPSLHGRRVSIDSAAVAADEVEAEAGEEDDDAWGFEEDPEGLTGVIPPPLAPAVGSEETSAIERAPGHVGSGAVGTQPVSIPPPPPAVQKMRAEEKPTESSPMLDNVDDAWGLEEDAAPEEDAAGSVEPVTAEEEKLNLALGAEVPTESTVIEEQSLHEASAPLTVQIPPQEDYPDNSQPADFLGVPDVNILPATPEQDRTDEAGVEDLPALPEPVPAVVTPHDEAKASTLPQPLSPSFNVLDDLEQPGQHVSRGSEGHVGDDQQQSFAYSPDPYAQGGYEDYQQLAAAEAAPAQQIDQQQPNAGASGAYDGAGHDYVAPQEYQQQTYQPQEYQPQEYQPRDFSYQNGYGQSYEPGQYGQQRSDEGAYTYGTGGAQPHDPTASQPARNDDLDHYAHSYEQGGTYDSAAYGLGREPQGAEYQVKDDYYGYDTAGMRDFAVDSTYPAEPEFQNQYLLSQASAPAHSVGLDPLDRQRANIALASFGFGGKLITAFPSASTTDAYGMSMATGGPSVTIRNIKTIIPAAPLEAYPGPLFIDGGSKASAGKKRKDVLAWLDGRIEEAEKRCTYLQGTRQMAGSNLAGQQDADSADQQAVQAAERTIMLRLVKVLVENEGKLNGKKAEESIHTVLKPENTKSNTSLGALPTADQLSTKMLSNRNAPNDASPTVATYTVRASHLDRLEENLSSGRRQEALNYAIDHQLWAHAFIIANSLGSQSWTDAVHAFTRSELGASPNGSLATGRASLRALYSLFAGGGAFAVEHFLPPRQLSPAPIAAPVVATGQGLLSPAQIPSRSPSPALLPGNDYRNVGQISGDVLREWRSTVALVAANRASGDSQFLVGIGDTLAANARIEAAHISYLLSAQDVFGGSDDQSARIGLLGAATEALTGPVDYEAIMLTEIVEFALSLAPVSKGQEQFAGLPHLQGYKLVLAHQYVASGVSGVGQKYCDAITATLKLAQKSSPYYHPALLTQVKFLSDRLTAAPAQEKGASWVSRKMQRPTLEGVWSTLEGRFSKFVAGEGEEPMTPKKPNAPEATGATLGPFSHYSSISPGSTSGQVSRAPSSSDLYSAARSTGNEVPHLAPADVIPSPPPTAKQSLPPAQPAVKGPPPAAATWKKGHHQRSSSLGTHGYSYDPYTPLSWGAYSGGNLMTPLEASPDPGAANAGELPAEPTIPEEDQVAEPSSGGGWWEASGGHSYEPASAAPLPSFSSAEDATGPDGESGFIDPMAGYTSPAPYQTAASISSQNVVTDTHVDDDDDLGLGNSKRKAPAGDAVSEEVKENEHRTEVQEPPKTEPTTKEDMSRPTLKPAPSSSWLGKWFKRDANASPGPIKAKLGDEVSLVYDPETKRWINKKAGGASPAATPSPPPPPARAQTASPTSALHGPNGRLPPASNGLPPPPRSMGSTPANPLPTGGGLPPPPLRSTASSSQLALPPATPPLPPGSAPPPGQRRPGTAASKKNLRARYVEIT